MANPGIARARHRAETEQASCPVIITHGWPGSVIELLQILDPLTNPTAHGASASDAFDVIIPSMPGYRYSGKPRDTGWGPNLIYFNEVDRGCHFAAWPEPALFAGELRAAFRSLR